MERDRRAGGGLTADSTGREWIAAGGLSLATFALLGFLLLQAARAPHPGATATQQQGGALPVICREGAADDVPGGWEWQRVESRADACRPSLGAVARASGGRSGSADRPHDSVRWDLPRAGSCGLREADPGAIVLAAFVVLAWLLGLTLIARPPRPLRQPSPERPWRRR